MQCASIVLLPVLVCVAPVVSTTHRVAKKDCFSGMGEFNPISENPSFEE